MLSLSFCWKERISLCRAMIWDIEKNSRQNLSVISSQLSCTLPMAYVYHCSAFPIRKKGNNFLLRVSCVMPIMANNEHYCWKFDKWWYEFSLSNPEKEGFRTRVIRSGKSSQLDVRIICVDDGGSGNSSLGAKRLWKDGFSLGSGGQGRRKEKQRIRGRLGSKKDTVTPRKLIKLNHALNLFLVVELEPSLKP